MALLDRALMVLAAALLAMTGLAAWLDVSQAWDVWYYHLPFAARLVGIVGGDSFVFSRLNQGRFEGFPLGGEIAQGLLWRLTGRPEAANLVAFSSIPLFAWLVRRWFAVPFHHAVLALFAVPLVQTHASASYVDLPANVSLACLVLLVLRAFERTGAPRARDAVVGLALASGAAHLRFQLAPPVLLALVLLATRAARRERLTLALGAPLVFAWPLKNLLRHGNPAYPVELRIGPFTMPGLDTPYASAPTWLENAPRPLRFFASVFEVGLRPLSDAGRWSVDQWTPPDHPGYRMGGFFGAYVVLLLVLLAWAWRAGKLTKTQRWAFLLLTGVVAFMPQSHELRYYMVWMLILVTLALRATPPASRPLVALACSGFAAVVIASTGGAYVRPSGSSFEELKKKRVDEALLAPRKEGARLCIARPPWNVLYAAPLRGDVMRYVVVEADSLDDCPR